MIQNKDNYIQDVLKKIKYFWERLNVTIQNCFWNIKLVVYSRHFKKK